MHMENADVLCYFSVLHALRGKRKVLQLVEKIRASKIDSQKAWI